MTTEHLEPPADELASLFKAEAKDLPAISPELSAAILERVGRTLGWGGPPAGGAAGGGWKLAALVVGALGLLGVGVAVHRGGGSGPDAVGTPESVRKDRPGGAASQLSKPYTELPAWFGDPSRPERSIGGRVTYQGAPVPGARVVLQSYATRAGVLSERVEIADAEGRFSFGSQRAATYDLTASADGAGYGHARVNTQNPTGSYDDVELVLSGCETGISGTVRDASGGVIAGAEVRPGRGQGIDITTVGTTAVTNDEGSYALCMGPGPAVVVVSADGYGAITLVDYVREWRTIDVSLLPAAAIIGRVVRADDGTPVRDARVWLNPSEVRARVRTYGAVASTDADGRFRMEGVAAGRHWLWADARPLAGYGSIVVGPAEESREVVLSVDDLGGVSGSVVHDGKPVAGATIGYTINGHARGSRDITDSAGRFALHSTGRAQVGFYVDGYQVLSPEQYEAGDTSKSVVVEVDRGSTIRGRVLANGAPAAGAQVTAFAGKQVAGRAETDRSGQYELTGLAPGTYRLRAEHHVRQAFTTAGSEKKIRLGDHERRDGVILELDGAASILGVVVDQQGAPVSGAAVQYANAENDQCHAITREDGSFSCTMLAGNSEYTPTVRPAPRAGVALTAADGELPTALLHDGTTQLTGITLRVHLDRNRISGRVVAQGGGPLPDVHVRGLSSQAGYTPANAPWVGFPGAVSDTAGEFDFEVWGSAPYTLHARAPDGGESVVANVKPGATGVVIELTMPGSAHGDLVGFDARPHVWFRPVGDTEEHLLAVVDANSYEIDGLAPGRYGVIAVTPRKAAGTIIEVRPGERVNAPLTAQPTTRLTATVRDFATGAPVAGTHCVVLPYLEAAGIFGFGVHASGPTNARGQTTFDAPTGLVEVTCLQDRQLHSGGAARVRIEEGETGHVDVLVLSTREAYQHAGLGARTLFSHREPTGHNHTVAELVPGGPADRAGLRVGDVIVAIDGRDVTPLIEIDSLVTALPRGRKVSVTIERAGHHRTVSIPL